MLQCCLTSRSRASADRQLCPVAQQNGVTGGDIMELEDEDLTGDLSLSRLQVPCLLESLRLTCAVLAGRVHAKLRWSSATTA